MSTEREQRYAEAIEDHGEAESEAGYNRWRCTCGEVIATGRKVRAISALREHQARAVEAVADAEQEEMRAEVERLQRLTLDVANGDGFTTQLGHALIVKCDDSGQTDLHRRAVSAEAEVARLTRLLEQRTAALTRTIDAKNTAEAKVTRVEALHAGHGHSVDGGKTWVHECLAGCGSWPCITTTALDGGQP